MLLTMLCKHVLWECKKTENKPERLLTSPSKNTKQTRQNLRYKEFQQESNLSNDALFLFKI